MPTDNHDFRQPPRGQTGWDSDWYHNFDTLDERVVARDVESNRSDYTAYENALFLATDTQNIFRGTGSGWEQLQSFGVNPDFGQATADKVVLNNAPVDPNDAVRLQDVDSGGSTEPGIGGTYSTTGDGTSTTFSWDTGVSDASAIQYVSIDPSSRSASTDYSRFVDGTSIGVEYDVPPDDGVTLSWFWTVNATVSTVEAVAHDHAGDTLNPDAVNAGSASVSSAPSVDTDVARKQELDTKADQDGGGTASLSNYASIQTETFHNIRFVTASDDLHTALSEIGPGGHIIVTDGVHETNGSVFTIGTEDVTLELRGEATLRMSDGDVGSLAYPHVVSVESDGVAIIGDGTIDCNWSNQYDTPASGNNLGAIRGAVSSGGWQLTIKGITIINWVSRAIEAQRASLTVENTRIGGGDGVGSIGIDLKTSTSAVGNASNIRIVDNTLGPFHPAESTDLKSSDVIRVAGDSDTTYETVTISRNHCLPPWGTATTTDGTGAYWFILCEIAARSVAITENVARAVDGDGSGDGIMVRQDTPSISEDAAITGNVLYGSGASVSDGIHVNAPAASVSGNVVRNFGQEAFRSYYKDFSLGGNYFEGTFNDQFSDNGIGFTPTDVSGSRAFDTTYTNDTGLTRKVQLVLTNGGGGIEAGVDVDGVRVSQYQNDNAPAAHTATLDFEVPPGSNYIINSWTDHGETVESWAEWFVR